MDTLPQTPSFRLDTKSALVVGASSGIGAAAAVALAQAGAKVTLAARSKIKLDALAQRLQTAGFNAATMALDIGDSVDIRQKIENTHFDILVNSAGIAKHGSACDTSSEDFDAVMAINAKGGYFLLQEVAKTLIKRQKPGSLITISSQMGHIGGIERALYCASKHAVEGYTKAMAIEFGKHNIRVNTVCPTFVRTSLTESTFEDPEKVRWLMDKIKLNRVAEVEDLMGAVVFLASDAAAMITGTALMVDGGWTAG